MNWQFDYSIPSLIVLLFFIIFYSLKPVLLTRSNKCFFALLILEIIGFITESYSCYVDLHSENYNSIFLTIINNMAYICLILRYYFISLYFTYGLQLNVKKDIPTIITKLIVTATIILVLLNPVLNLFYTITPEGKFVRAKYYMLFHYGYLVTLLLDAYYLIKCRHKLNKKEALSSIITITSLLICSLMNIYFIEYLVTDMFFSFTIMGLFFVFENPDIILDKRTGLLNFSAFNTIISENLSAGKKFSLITFSIKNYTEKRQIYGSKQADLTLKEIGKFFLTLYHTRKCFYLRNGTFVLMDKTQKDFPQLEKTISERFQKPWIINNTELHINIIIIDTEKDVKFKTFDEISSSFGIAFLDAQKKSLNHITITKESFVEISRRTKVSIALNRALLENELQVYMQPIVDSITRKIVAAEALVRIYDKDLGIIPPAEFITMAEKNGSIEQLGEQVLNKVCEYLHSTDIYKYGIKWINVNLSPIQCQNKNLPAKIDKITQMNTVKHQYIHLEITEDSMIDTDVLKNQMDLLVTAGYKFSLDDFGSGFSNVARVKRYPFSNIKLDMSIVREHFKNPDDILPSVVKTFNNRGFTVTAEGVETKEMADMLEKMGCKYLQGYYFSKPIPVQDFTALLESK